MSYSDRPQFYEKQFLETHKEEDMFIFLSNGTKLDCRIISYDDVCFIVTVKQSIKKTQMIYKNQVASICPK